MVCPSAVRVCHSHPGHTDLLPLLLATPNMQTPARMPYFPLGKPRLAPMIRLTQIGKQKQGKEAVLLP